LDSVVGWFGLDSVRSIASWKNEEYGAWVSLLDWINAVGLLYVFQSSDVVEGCCTLMI
jgi:hypothetical protein